MCRGHRISDDVEPFRLRSGWVFVYRVCRQAEGLGFPNRSNLSMSSIKRDVKKKLLLRPERESDARDPAPQCFPGEV